MLRQKTFDYVPIPIGVFLFNHFLSSHINFICINNKQAHFEKMYPTVASQFFFLLLIVLLSTDFIKVTARSAQLIKLSIDYIRHMLMVFELAGLR